ncbi:hypothetical protein [Mucilaginibacter ginsenosidivorax]|uniref:Uncharacterized protein n=1 Tax=Mucilaginibacter ginsenosidivorax TaxID=862126 RepID=A0A5B8W1S6_9SPHI|nr:hypothetical protein [Mucilaginibacter ginsenosidivorax]QEC77980.1 hypothetical protein FSB76_19305 [Mucilaginibacter ginsenosidivorax]
MKYLSRDKYAFTTGKDAATIKNILLLNTSINPKLVMINTNKRFIGQVSNNSFQVIGSGKKSVLCVIEGKFEPSEDEKTAISVETRLHKAFLILFIIWAILMLAILMVSPFLSEPKEPFSLLILFPFFIAVCFFRLLLHGGYVLSRNAGVKAINRLLE